jgi:hypothetical protein
MKSFAGWPRAKINAGILGLIVFDADGFATVSDEQAEWLTDKIEAGALEQPAAVLVEVLDDAGADSGADTGADTGTDTGAEDEAATVELTGVAVEKAPKAPKAPKT